MSVITAPNVSDEFLQCWLQVNNITLENLTIKTAGHTVSTYLQKFKGIIQESDILVQIQHDYQKFISSFQNLEQNLAIRSKWIWRTFLKCSVKHTNHSKCVRPRFFGNLQHGDEQSHNR